MEAGWRKARSSRAVLDTWHLGGLNNVDDDKAVYTLVICSYNTCRVPSHLTKCRHLQRTTDTGRDLLLEKQQCSHLWVCQFPVNYFTVPKPRPYGDRNAIIITIFGQPFVKRFALCYRSVVLSVTFVHCGPTVGWIKMKLGMQVCLGPGHIVLGGEPAPPPPKGHSPKKFSAHISCGQMVAWIKMPLSMELGLGPGNFVLDGDPAPPSPNGAEPPKFSAHVYCGQMAGWIKTVLGMEIGLSTGNFVLDGDPAPLAKRGRSLAYCGDMWRRYCCSTSFCPIVDTCLSCEDIARQNCATVPRWRIFGDFLGPAFPASRAHHISDLHLKFALRPHHVWKYGRHQSVMAEIRRGNKKDRR